MDVILLGAPGAGKGTQAQVLEEHIGLVHVASGDLFRAALRRGTELGMLAKSYMDRGELVPDEVVIRMIIERISQNDCASGVIFDGFPRTVAQAEALDAMLGRHGTQIDRVIRLEVNSQKLIDRVAKRFAEEGRKDDNPESFKIRLQAYTDQTAPLIPYYEKQGKLVGVDGMADVDAVAKSIATALDNL